MQSNNKTTMDKTKRSLILAGGGMRLAYQGGVLMAIEENQMEFDHIDGTSGGIFNAGMLASGLNAYEIAARWRKLNIKKFISYRPIKSYLNPLNMMGYADADGIRDVIFPGLGIDIKKINAHQGADTTFNVCNFSNKSVESIGHKSVTTDHLLAGVSLPIMMPGLKIGEQWYSDAVWIKDANLMEAVRRGAEELWLVWAIGNTPTYLSGALNQYVHMIEMSANGGLLEEYDRIAMVNEKIVNGQEAYGQKKPIRLFVIKPSLPLPLDPDLFFNKIDARSLVNMGYAHGKKALKSMPEQGIPMDEEATKMNSPGNRLNIRSKFTGTLSQGEKRIKSQFYTYFVLSELEGSTNLNIYSSFKMEGFEFEISCYDHRIKTFDKDRKRMIKCTCSYLHAGEVHGLTATFVFNSATEIMLGLAFKSVYIEVSKKPSKPIASGVLYQSAGQRIKNLFPNNTRKPDGTSGRVSLKYKLATKLLKYAV